MNEISKSEFNILIRLTKKILWASPIIRKRMQHEHVNVVPANYYSDIPLIEDIESNFEKNFIQGPYTGIIEENSVVSFTQSILEYADEFDPSLNESEKGVYYWKNPAFSYCDAMAYYCIVRKIRPRRILEIGSGYSTLVANQAVMKNGTGEIVCIEPYPFDFLEKTETVTQVIDKKIQKISVEEFGSLMLATDILFLDSTHTCKIGSDCLYIYLILLPSIKKQIMVHSHDIYLPWGMPEEYALEKHIYWTEQYLLYAYLVNHSHKRVVFPSCYISKTNPQLAESLMKGKYGIGGASFWYELGVI